MQYCLSLSAGIISPLLVAKNPLEYFASYAFLSFNICLLLLRKSLAFTALCVFVLMLIESALSLCGISSLIPQHYN